MKTALSHIFAVAGLVSLGVGLWLAHPPTCLIVLGAIFLTAGVIGAIR